MSTSIKKSSCPLIITWISGSCEIRVGSNCNSNVRRVGIKEAITLNEETDDLIRLDIHHCRLWCEFNYTDLVLDSFWLDVCIVESRRDDLIHYCQREAR